MNRRRLIKSAASAALLPSLASPMFSVASAEGTAARLLVSRVRPGDPAWPSAASWDELNRDVGGRLIEVRWPLRACHDDPVSMACGDLFAELKNPYYVGDEVGLTQTAGWLDAWSAQPSVFAVAAETTGDVVAAVNFARENNLRLVVKGAATAISGPPTRRIRC